MVTIAQCIKLIYNNAEKVKAWQLFSYNISNTLKNQISKISAASAIVVWYIHMSTCVGLCVGVAV
jgi:hypothetical protein